MVVFTVEIPKDLKAAAKATAAADSKTLKVFVSEALQEKIEKSKEPKNK